jgi:hypothetical protein
MKFVPPQFREESAPCRFIPVTEAGETVHHFYQSGTQMELEEALACWLRKQIEQMATTIDATRTVATDQEDEVAKLAEA